jgi:hypothetical protein
MERPSSAALAALAKYRVITFRNLLNLYLPTQRGRGLEGSKISVDIFAGTERRLNGRSARTMIAESRHALQRRALVHAQEGRGPLTMMIGSGAQGGGIGGFGIAEEEETPLSGTGGAAGPGTRAGEGQVSGEGTARDSGIRDGERLAPAHDVAAAGEPAGRSGSEASKEAAALGDLDDHDETPALEYGEGDRPRPPTIGEALGSGAGSSVGSGTPPDRAGLGGSETLQGEIDPAGGD